MEEETHVSQHTVTEVRVSVLQEFACTFAGYLFSCLYKVKLIRTVSILLYNNNQRCKQVLQNNHIYHLI